MENSKFRFWVKAKGFRLGLNDGDSGGGEILYVPASKLTSVSLEKCQEGKSFLFILLILIPPRSSLACILHLSLSFFLSFFFPLSLSPSSVLLLLALRFFVDAPCISLGSHK